jgi:hypothetical protein
MYIVNFCIANAQNKLTLVQEDDHNSQALNTISNKHNK